MACPNARLTPAHVIARAIRAAGDPSARVADTRLSDSISLKIILEADDIILTKVASALDLDQDEPFRAAVRDAMPRAHRHVNSLALIEDAFNAVERDPGLAFDDDPMLAR
jgi:hypothetical protein